MAHLSRTHSVALCALAIVVLVSLAAKRWGRRRRVDDALAAECRHHVTNASKNLTLARQDRSEVHQLVHCAYARAYLSSAMHAMPTETLSKQCGIDVLRLSRSIDRHHDAALVEVNGRAAQRTASRRPKSDSGPVRKVA